MVIEGGRDRKMIRQQKTSLYTLSDLNGENLLDTGIYSLLNPIMLLAYATSAALKVSNTITVYIFFVSVLSALFYQCAMKKWKLIDLHGTYCCFACLAQARFIRLDIGTIFLIICFGEL